MNSSVSGRRARRRIAKAKSKARPGKVYYSADASVISEDGSINSVPFSAELLVSEDYDEWRCMNLAKNFDLSLEPIAKRDIVPRLNVKLYSHAKFIEDYEKPLLPAVLTNVVDSWLARENWTFDNLLKCYRNKRFKCGEDDYGYNVKLKMKYFIYYMRSNCDDSPLYIFDGNFGEVSSK